MSKGFVPDLCSGSGSEGRDPLDEHGRTLREAIYSNHVYQGPQSPLLHLLRVPTRYLQTLDGRCVKNRIEIAAKAITMQRQWSECFVGGVHYS